MDCDNERPRPPRLANDPATCSRCGAAMELKVVLARLGQQPGHRVFGCTACTALEWIEADRG